MTIQYMSQGDYDENENLRFGISKHKYGEWKRLGDLKYDWSIDLINGKKYNNKKEIKYGEEGKVGDIYTCVVNRKEGSVKFIHNGKDLGVAFKDEAINEGALYFAVSCTYEGQWVKILESSCE